MTVCSEVELKLLIHCPITDEVGFEQWEEHHGNRGVLFVFYKWLTRWKWISQMAPTTGSKTKHGNHGVIVMMVVMLVLKGAYLACVTMAKGVLKVKFIYYFSKSQGPQDLP